MKTAKKSKKTTDKKSREQATPPAAKPAEDPKLETNAGNDDPPTELGEDVPPTAGEGGESENAEASEHTRYKSDKKKVETPIERGMEHLPKRDWFTVMDVAIYFAVSDRTIRLWIEHGQLESKKIVGSVRVSRQSIIDCVVGKKHLDRS